MTKKQLTEWVNDLLWPLYQELVKTPFATKWKQGQKGEAIKRVITINPSKDLRERIFGAIDAQIKHRKKLYEFCGSMQAYLDRVKYDKFYANRMCSTWLNQLGYEDEIPSLTFESVDLDSPTDTCTHAGCESAVHGPRFNLCDKHLADDNSDELKAHLRKIGLGKSKDETREEYLHRCRVRFTELYGSLGFR